MNRTEPLATEAQAIRQPDFSIAHAPRSMLITDSTNSRLAVL